VNVPGLLTSSDCIGGEDGGMTPLEKWYLGLSIPVAILATFVIWSRFLPHNSIAREAVEESGVQVCFVWLFESIVTTGLKVFDCEKALSGKLIMDPERVTCSFSSPQYLALAVVGLLVLVMYVIVPYSWFIGARCCTTVDIICCRRDLANLCRYMKEDQAQVRPIQVTSLPPGPQSRHTTSQLDSRNDSNNFNSRNDSDNFKFFFGWALEDYKEDLDGWEICKNKRVVFKSQYI